MNGKLLSALMVCLLFATGTSAHKGHTHTPKINVSESEKTLQTQWQGKSIAFLGDSMTDPNSNASECYYWRYLEELLGIERVVYARSGFQWDGILNKAHELIKDHPQQVDAIVIWAGTNDFNHSIPMGAFFTETEDSVVHNGKKVLRKHRSFSYDQATFCGRINRVLYALKDQYPEAQILVMTPIHRAYATFGPNNVQPDEMYANGVGLYLESYVETLKQAAQIWSVPVLDLYGTSGLNPLLPSHQRYFHDSKTDLLHPNALGHYHLAKCIQYKLLLLPVYSK